mmetsp:Transcript_8445/g.18970  ORF Transcript_8445/g.18970 Transcript_8445/m.18970 type:complete len:136 (-) Transcript_8445:726-1133(-)
MKGTPSSAFLNQLLVSQRYLLLGRYTYHYHETILTVNQLKMSWPSKTKGLGYNIACCSPSPFSTLTLLSVHLTNARAFCFFRIITTKQMDFFHKKCVVRFKSIHIFQQLLVSLLKLLITFERLTFFSQDLIHWSY